MKNTPMEEDKEHWIDGVLNSLEGAERARPSVDLFERIEREVSDAGPGFYPGFRRRIAVAAAVILLAGNVFALLSWQGQHSSGTSNPNSETSNSQPLVPGYNLYD